MFAEVPLGVVGFAYVVFVSVLLLVIAPFLDGYRVKRADLSNTENKTRAPSLQSPTPISDEVRETLDELKFILSNLEVDPEGYLVKKPDLAQVEYIPMKEKKQLK